MDEAVDPKSRVATFLDRFGKGLDYEEFEDLVHSIAKTADHWDDKLA